MDNVIRRAKAMDKTTVPPFFDELAASEPNPGGEPASGNDGRTPVEWDDDLWDVFLPDGDSLDPQPEPGDFWEEPDQFAAISPDQFAAISIEA